MISAITLISLRDGYSAPLCQMNVVDKNRMNFKYLIAPKSFAFYIVAY